MPVRIEQPGAAKAAAQAGAIIGKGKRAEEERARAEREQARAQQIQAQQSARKAALEWEQQKMLLNSQQDFAHEMRMRQAQLDKEARAQEWAGEKMEMASRFDFEQDEKERIRRKATYNAGSEAIKNNETYTDMQRAEAEFLLAKEFFKDVPEAAAKLGMEPEISPNIKRRKELEAVVGPEFGRAMSLQELEEEVGIADLSPEDLTELGLDPADFPDAGKETEYEIGQVVSTPQGDMTIIGFDDDGEPLVESAIKEEVKFPFRKVGSLRDLTKRLKRPVGSINDLLGR